MTDTQIEDGCVFNAEKINAQLEKLEYAKQEAIEFAMWVHFNWQHLGDKFFLQRDGLSLDTIEEIEKTAITREEMYNLYQQSKK